MDSMRTLNTSLPTSYSNRPAPPEQLLQAFRTAALSVTNLYKSAVTDQNNSRASGYQDALDDLLSFLDRENLGLQDGEGWRVRQWATERYDGTANHRAQGEAEDERSEVDREVRTSTPATVPTSEPPPIRTAQIPPEAVVDAESDTNDGHSEPVVQEPIFRFTGGTSDQPSDDMQTDHANLTEIEHAESSSSSPNVPIRVEVVNRGNRTPHRPTGTRHNTRSSNREFTFTAGTKRKLQFPDFFDISNIYPRDESGGGGKRGRLA